MPTSLVDVANDASKVGATSEAVNKRCLLRKVVRVVEDAEGSYGPSFLPPVKVAGSVMTFIEVMTVVTVTTVGAATAATSETRWP